MLLGNKLAASAQKNKKRRNQQTTATTHSISFKLQHTGNGVTAVAREEWEQLPLRLRVFVRCQQIALKGYFHFVAAEKEQQHDRQYIYVTASLVALTTATPLPTTITTALVSLVFIAWMNARIDIWVQQNVWVLLRTAYSLPHTISQLYICFSVEKILKVFWWWCAFVFAYFTNAFQFRFF